MQLATVLIYRTNRTMMVFLDWLDILTSNHTTSCDQLVHEIIDTSESNKQHRPKTLGFV